MLTIRFCLVTLLCQKYPAMFSQYHFTCVDRFLKYVQIDTQSNPQNNTSPSTDKQKNLSYLLAEELLTMGITDAHVDEYGYVYATIPSNSANKVPTICFCSHVDTAPDCSGTGVKPILQENYDGEDIVLPDDESIVNIIICIGDSTVEASERRASART